jgi:hypothetical protein
VGTWSGVRLRPQVTQEGRCLSFWHGCRPTHSGSSGFGGNADNAEMADLAATAHVLAHVGSAVVSVVRPCPH